MKNKDIANGAVAGFIGLVVAPIVVGVVANSAGKCYSKIAREVDRIKNRKNKQVSDRGRVIDFDDEYRKMGER